MGGAFIRTNENSISSELFTLHNVIGIRMFNPSLGQIFKLTFQSQNQSQEENYALEKED